MRASVVKAIGALIKGINAGFLHVFSVLRSLTVLGWYAIIETVQSTITLLFSPLVLAVHLVQVSLL